MSTEKMNAEFEIWRKEQVASLVRKGYPDAAKAFRDLGSIQWAGFQAGWIASRATIEVELPDDGIEDCRRGWPERGESIAMTPSTPVISMPVKSTKMSFIH